MNKDTKQLLFVIGTIVLIWAIASYFLLTWAYKVQTEYEAECNLLGIDCKSGNMNPECANDCRNLNYKEFKYDKEGFGAWACYCLKPGRDVMKIW